ncbi:MAG: hypothetical protein C0179_08330 [Fervidicoccus sp.]|nr:MAG: hypothetical protein C0179_08330 [Fervidicoccus sp.]
MSQSPNPQNPNPNPDSEKEAKEIKRYARNTEELVFNTNTDESDYPLYILSDFELVHKKYPSGREIIGSFNVRVSEIKDEELPLTHQLFEKAKSALEEITRSSVSRKNYEIIYESYRGDFEEYLADAKAYAIKLIAFSPFSLMMKEKSFAVVYGWLKRLSAKYPDLSKYAYVSRYEGRKLKHSYAILVIKLPISTPELEDVFKKITSPPVEVEEPTAVESVESEEEPKPEEIPTIEIKPKLRLRLRLPEEIEERVEVKEEKPSKPEKSELVKIYLLSMRLPSKYLVQKVYYEKNKEIREFNDVSGKLETIRREAYSMITRAFAYVEEYGTWIAVSDDAVKEAYNVSEYVIKRLKELNLHDKVERYIVKAIPIYLDPLDAKELLDAAVKRLSQDLEELERRIREAEEEKKRQALKRLEREKSYKEKLLEAFKRYLSEISRGEAGE